MLYEVKADSRHIIESHVDLYTMQNVCFLLNGDVKLGTVMQKARNVPAKGSLLYATDVEEIQNNLEKTAGLTIVNCMNTDTGSKEYLYVSKNALIEKGDTLVSADPEGNLAKYTLISKAEAVAEDQLPNKLVVFIKSSTDDTRGKDWCQPKGISIGDTVHYANRHTRTIMSPSEINSVLREISQANVLYVEDGEHSLKYFRCTDFKNYIITSINVGDILFVYNLSKKEFKRICIKQNISGKYYVNTQEQFKTLPELVQDVIKYNYVIKHIDKNDDVVYERIPGLSLEVIK